MRRVSISSARAFLGRRSHERHASGAKGSTGGTNERRERGIVQRAASAVGEAGLRPAGADGGEVRA